MLRPLHRLGRARSAAPAETRARFDAFISYSRANDAPLAVALQAALQRFTKPWYRLRVLHVFRDDASLSANPGLWSSIEQALQASRFLVLIASEDAARSNWVNAEVGWWCAHKSVERLLLVLANGEAMWDGPRRDFVWQANTALPAALRGVFQEEPRYVDLRFARTPDQFAANEPRFRDAVADLAAPIHGRPKDEMIGEDVRQHRRTLRTARAAGGILTVLALGAATAAFLAVRARDEARRETRLATAREVAAQSDLAARDGRLDLALLLAARSWLTDRTSEGRDALLAALNAATQLVAVRHTAPLSAVAASADGRMLALLGENGRVRLWDGLRRRPLDARLPAGTAFRAMHLEHVRVDVSSRSDTKATSTCGTGGADDTPFCVSPVRGNGVSPSTA